MPLLRTPDERFANLPDFLFAPRYVEINGARMHYVDEGRGRDVVLCLHGEPSWSFLYRHMITPLAQHYRVLAPDLIGFGRSDKYSAIADYSYSMHHDMLAGFIRALELSNITLVGQDWGGILGLPIAAEMPERFARLVIMNTGLPSGDVPITEGFMQWRAFAERVGRDLPISLIFERSLASGSLPPAIKAAYEAPFPDAAYKAGAAALPLLVPLKPDDPGAAEIRQARERLKTWQKPALVLFSDGDPVTRGGDRFFRKLIPTANDQPEITITGAGHFLQEEKGAEIAAHLDAFIRRTPLG